MENLRQEVALKSVRFFAYHGFYPEEQLIGSVFFVDVIAGFRPGRKTDDELANTVNYEKLYAIAERSMRQTAKLIETVAERILQDIQNEFGFVDTITVRIKKMNPPIKGEVGHSEVHLSWSR